MLRPILPIRPRRFFLLGTLAVLLTLVGLISLPHSDYVKFNSLTDREVVKLGWVYERLHFDPTPIDVVFVGSSHTVFGVDSAAVETGARERGVALHAVNFGLQHLGRNMQWLLAKQAIENRSVRMVVIELQYDESRSMHPAFFAVAEAKDLIEAPVLINTSFASDLARLPARQAGLFARSVLPGLFDAQTAFEPALYRGPHWDDTLTEEGSPAHPIANLPPRTTSLKASEVADERASWDQRRASKLRLPARFAGLETRASFAYVSGIVALAHAHGVKVQFLYLPCYGDPAAPENAAFYDSLAATWHPPADVLAPLDHWHDINHLNHTGALALSTWAGQELAKALTRPRAPVEASLPAAVK